MTAQIAPTRRNFLLGLGGANLLFIPPARAVQSTGLAGILFTELGAHSIAADVRLIRTAGYSTIGRGSALYALDPDQGPISATGQALAAAAVSAGRDRAAATRAILAIETRCRRQSGDGRWWRLAESEPTSDMFGALGDATYDFRAPAASTGTDATASLQALLDYCIRYARCPARISPGLHLVSDTLHLGYGDDFVQIEVIGAGPRFDGQAAFMGSLIHSTRRDRPVINVQGGRSVRIRGLAIGGYLAKRVSDLGMAYNTRPLTDDTDPANWDDPAAGIVDRRYAPYAAICIDGFAGTNPDNGYPVTRPDWVPHGEVPYGSNPSSPDRKRTSSGIIIEDCEILGFTVGVMCNPSNSPEQGDFLKLRNCRITRCKYALSVGNNQSRNVAMEDCNIALYYCVVTNRIHGTQTGQLGGTFLNTSMGAGIDLIDIDTSYATPITFLNCYCEAQWRIGRISAGSSADTGLTFKDCHLNLRMSGDTGEAADNRGLPGAHLYNPAAPTSYSAGIVRFEGGLVYVDRVLSLMATTMIDGTNILQVARGGTVRAEHERHFHNALAGGVALPRLDGSVMRQVIKYEPVDLDTGVKGGVWTTTDDGAEHCNRTFGTSTYARTIRASSDRRFEMIPSARRGFEAGKPQFRNYSWSGKELSFEWVGATRDHHGALLGVGPGGAMLDPVTGSVFAIRAAVESRGALTVTAILQNNYRTGEGRRLMLRTAIDLAAGSWFFAHGRGFTLPRRHMGDFTAGSPSITAVATEDGVTQTTGHVVAGDFIEANPAGRAVLSADVAKIVSIGEGGGTIMIEGPAALTARRERLARFIRALPANE